MFKSLRTALYNFLATMKWLGLSRISALDFRSLKRCKTHLATPPLDPRPSQYAGPLPSITCPGAPVMITSVPEIKIGSKSLSEVVAKV
jgi:hypothetical protein